MRDTALRALRSHNQPVELSYEERSQLNTIIDLLIPPDDGFPAPSSLQLLDEFLKHLQPSTNKTPLMLSPKRLRTVLRDLNSSAGGRFCSASAELQQALLRRLEKREPAVFQALWTLANHSYYAQLATRRPSSLS
jgi:hypothetical protein